MPAGATHAGTPLKAKSVGRTGPVGGHDFHCFGRGTFIPLGSGAVHRQGFVTNQLPCISAEAGSYDLYRIDFCK